MSSWSDLLGFLGFGGPGPVQAFAAGSPSPGPRGYDPAAQRHQALGLGLLNMGAAIASAPRGNFIGPGLLGFSQGMQEGDADYRRQLLDRLDLERARRDGASAAGVPANPAGASGYGSMGGSGPIAGMGIKGYAGPIPLDASGRIDEARLIPGSVYMAADADRTTGLWRWGGASFVPFM